MLNKNTASNKTNTKNQYNYCEKVKYEKDKVLEFPDFYLKYAEQKTTLIPSEKNPEDIKDSIIYDVFEIFKGNQKTTVSLAIYKQVNPSNFEFNNKEYILEKRSSIFHGKLEKNELVISTKEKYEKQKQQNK